MFGKKTGFALFCAAFSINTFGQKTPEIFIRDAYTERPIPGAWLIPDRTEDTLFAADDGYLSEKALLRTNFIAVGAKGYQKDTLIIFKGGIYRVFLIPEAKNLDLVGIVSERADGNKLLTPLYGSRMNKGEPFIFDNLQMPRFLNTIPGVQWEQRGVGGSAKLSVRGSGWRSSFGIRGTRIYLDEIPLSQSDGFGLPELADPYFFESLEFFKGPAGVRYGGYAGGSLILKTKAPEEYGLTFDIGTTAGSNRLLRGQAGASYTARNFHVYAKGMSMVHRGYRQQEYVNRKLYMAGADWQFHPNHTLILKTIYGISNWGLPGDLTATKAAEDPRMANPYSLAVSARLEKRFFRGGITHRFRQGERFTNEFTLYAHGTDKYNPYGTVPTFSGIKDEQIWGIGIREHADMHFGKKYPLHVQAGFEYQTENVNGRETENKGGTEGNERSRYNLSHHLFFAYLKASLLLPYEIRMEGGLNTAVSGIRKNELIPDTAIHETASGWKPGFYPFVGVSKKAGKYYSFFARYSHGYTTPTITELLSENGFLNAALGNERMQQTEIGTRGQLSEIIMSWGLGAYYHHFTRYIVPYYPTPESPVRYTNAGAAAQWGIEAEWDYTPFKTKKIKSALKQSDVALRYQYTQGRFIEFTESGTEYSGYQIPGTASHRVTLLGALVFRYGFRLDMDLTYRSGIWLNYKNTDRTPGVIRGNMRIAWSGTLFSVLRPELFFGINNFTGAKDYSFLRINAPGGRYFNPDHGIFFYGGVNIRSSVLLKKVK
jgi:iron complex outermembrane receptor protein